MRPALTASTKTDAILRAVRAGATTVHDIARVTGQNHRLIGSMLVKLAERGVVARSGLTVAHGAASPGRSMIVWRMSDDSTSLGVGESDIPPWVLTSHRATYAEIARVMGEEDAARYARRAKALAAPVERRGAASAPSPPKTTRTPPAALPRAPRANPAR